MCDFALHHYFLPIYCRGVLGSLWMLRSSGCLSLTPCHIMPMLVGVLARPRHTCPGFCRAKPGCSGMLLWMGDLARPHRTCPRLGEGRVGSAWMPLWGGALVGSCSCVSGLGVYVWGCVVGPV